MKLDKKKNVTPVGRRDSLKEAGELHWNYNVHIEIELFLLHELQRFLLQRVDAGFVQ